MKYIYQAFHRGMPFIISVISHCVIKCSAVQYNYVRFLVVGLSILGAYLPFITLGARDFSFFVATSGEAALWPFHQIPTKLAEQVAKIIG